MKFDSLSSATTPRNLSMKCWNCLKEIPDGAASCGYCEAKQETVSSEFMDAAKGVLQGLDPALLAELENKMRSAETAEDFVSSIFCPPCPACDSCKVETCDEVVGIENPMVGRCRDCCALFCTDCSRVFRDEKEAGSASATRQCPSCGGSNTSFPKNEEENSDVPPEAYECFDCGKAYCSSCGRPN